MGTYQTLHKKIKEKQIAPLYLFYGQEEFLIEETVSLLVNTVLTDEEKEMNLSVYDMSEVPIEVALEDAETLPFLGEKRVVIVKDPYFFTGQKDKNKIDHDLKKLEEYLQTPSPDAVVIFSGFYEKLDERKKIVKLFEKRGEIVHMPLLDEQALRAWVKNRVKNDKKEIEDRALDLLLLLVGPKLILLANEIDKVITYMGVEKKIDQAVIQNIVVRSLEQNVFALIDLIVKARTEEALAIYYDLLEQKEEPIKILALIAGQFRFIYQVKSLYTRGYGQKQTASYLKSHPFRVKLAAEQSARFTEQELEDIIKTLADVDYKMKTGKMDKKLLLELFILQLKK